MRSLVILLITSGATVLGTWLSFKMHAGLLGAWLVSTAIIAVGTMMTRTRNDF